jgi:maltooligosyltrehalose synthase
MRTNVTGYEFIASLAEVLVDDEQIDDLRRAQANSRAEGDIDPAADDHQRQRQGHDPDADKIAGAE